MNIKTKVMVTGHRPERLRGREVEVAAWLDQQLRELEPYYAISGMAEGVDQIYAELALRQHIRLAAALPFRKDMGAYHPHVQDLLLKATEVVYACDRYSKQSYIIRDKLMVDSADIVLAVWDGIESGGTWQTIKYAREQGKEIRYFLWDK